MDFLWSVTFPVQSLLTCWVISEILCNVVNWISIEERLFFFLPHFYSFHFFLSSVHNCEDHFHIHINFILLRSYIYRHARVRSYTSTCFRWQCDWMVKKGKGRNPVSHITSRRNFKFSCVRAFRENLTFTWNERRNFTGRVYFRIHQFINSQITLPFKLNSRVTCWFWS